VLLLLMMQGAVVAAYRKMQIATQKSTPEQRVVFAERRAQREAFRSRKTLETNKGRGNLIRNLPKDCPY
jgi:hypothetical protein